MKKGGFLMWYKNPKLWGTILTIGLTALMVFTGMDLKKYVCENDSIMNDIQLQDPAKK
jgi:hypothetical protein